ncbi:MAG: hypothetical protein K6V97_15015 [Actinomycetia bacterium]|nr:hypothetical protein [Actinomycetes bacterium]
MPGRCGTAGAGARLRQLVQQAGHTVPLDEAIFAMVVNRLADPQSKRGMLSWLPAFREQPDIPFG